MLEATLQLLQKRLLELSLDETHGTTRMAILKPRLAIVCYSIVLRAHPANQFVDAGCSHQG